jgi:hypothetical protein
MKGLVILASVGLCMPALAQTLPTATEAFNLRIRCKQMAEEKFQSLRSRPMTVEEGASIGWSPREVQSLNRNLPQEIHAHYNSKYDPINNHCYAEAFIQMRTQEFEMEYRQIYDVQVDDLLAFAQIQDGKKSGLVFDRQYRPTEGSNVGWDDANAYIDEMMADNRR